MKKKTKIALAATFAVAISIPAVGHAEKTGEQVFKQTGCVSCHGVSGTGNIPGVPDFTKENGILVKDDSVLIDHITNGYRSEGNNGLSMPSYKRRLQPTEIENVVKYLKQTFKR